MKHCLTSGIVVYSILSDLGIGHAVLEVIVLGGRVAELVVALGQGAGAADAIDELIAS